MTNEEKARDLISVSNTNQVYDVVDFNTLHESLYEDLMEMAKWKDEQFEDMKEKIKVDTKIEVGYELREKISNGASIMSLDTYARHLCNL